MTTVLDDVDEFINLFEQSPLFPPNANKESKTEHFALFAPYIYHSYNTSSHNLTILHPYKHYFP